MDCVRERGALEAGDARIGVRRLYEGGREG